MQLIEQKVAGNHCVGDVSESAPLPVVLPGKVEELSHYGVRVVHALAGRIHGDLTNRFSISNQQWLAPDNPRKATIDSI